MKKMMYLPFLIFLLACGNHPSDPRGIITAGENKAVFTITPAASMTLEKTAFKAGNYSLDFSEAVVKEGSYSGIEFDFTLKENDTDDLFLRFELPAAKTMKVYYTNDGVQAEMPAVPFKVTEKDFQGLKNALYDKEQLTYIEIERHHRYASDASNSTSFAFCMFELEITKAEFGKKDFSMDCHFKGQADDTYKKATGLDYTIEGSFSISGKGYSLAQVD
jgi:hypothetical protein